MSVENNRPDRQDLIFHPKFDTQKSYLLKVDKVFLEQLKTIQQFIVQGKADSEIIINTLDNSYKIKGINISTQMLVINDKGTIFLQTSSYLDVQKYSPHFHEIYQTIVEMSCKMPNNLSVEDFQHFLNIFGFTQLGIRKQCYLSEQDFQRISKAMNLVKITAQSQNENFKYLYISLHFSVWIMREIIKIFNQQGRSLFQSMPISKILQRIPLINLDMAHWIMQQYETIVQNTQNMNQVFRLTPKSIMKFIIGEMAIAKKQYVDIAFNEVIDQMLMVYMPAEYQINSSMLNNAKDRLADKMKQELFNCRFDYFIQVKDKYINYDYMQIQTEIGPRLKYLAAYKNRWRIYELNTIFRGVDSTQNGKYYCLSDVLLKKFRKYGDQYEIKFILPNK